jgi:hypothetical protein
MELSKQVVSLDLARRLKECNCYPQANTSTTVARARITSNTNVNTAVRPVERDTPGVLLTGVYGEAVARILL